MLLKPYQNLKSQLSSISGIKLIEWFNDQYAGTIHAAPAIFVEFLGELRFETVSKQTQQAAFTARIHLASKAISKQDGSIDDSLVSAHFGLCDEIYKLLQGHRAMNVDKLMFNSLSRSAFEHHQYMKGWLVTTQDFEGMLYQLKTVETGDKPAISILQE
jgi:hypothetical protein